MSVYIARSAHAHSTIRKEKQVDDPYYIHWIAGKLHNIYAKAIYIKTHPRRHDFRIQQLSLHHLIELKQVLQLMPHVPINEAVTEDSRSGSKRSRSYTPSHSPSPPPALRSGVAAESLQAAPSAQSISPVPEAQPASPPSIVAGATSNLAKHGVPDLFCTSPGRDCSLGQEMTEPAQPPLFRLTDDFSTTAPKPVHKGFIKHECLLT